MTEIMVSRMCLPPAELSQSTRAEFMALQVTEIEFLQAVNVGHQGGYVSYSQAGSCPPLEIIAPCSVARALPVRRHSMPF